MSFGLFLSWLQHAGFSKKRSSIFITEYDTFVFKTSGNFPSEGVWIISRPCQCKATAGRSDSVLRRVRRKEGVNSTMAQAWLHKQKRGVCVLRNVTHTRTHLQTQKYKYTKIQIYKNTPLHLRDFMACSKLLNCLTPPPPPPHKRGLTILI